MEASNPHFLLAMPELNDPYFEKGVVVMIHHNQEGAVGFLVNKPLQLTLGEFAKAKGVFCSPSLAPLQVYMGGPVELDHGWILHKDESITEKQLIVDGIYLSGTQNTLYELMAKGASPFKLILGYSGWSSHQLEDEMKVGSWLTTDILEEFLFWPENEKTWEAVLQNKGIDPSMLASVSGVH